MIRYQPTLRRRVVSFGLDSIDLAQDPVNELAAMMDALQQHEPRILTSLRSACASLDMDLSDGIAWAIRVDPRTCRAIDEDVPRADLPELSSEDLFTACRDALTGDRTLRLWRSRGPTYHDLVLVVGFAATEFERGYDPREPW